MVKQTYNIKAGVLETSIIQNCTSNISYTYNNCFIRFINPDNLFNFVFQLFYIITISLLSKAAKMI